MQCAYLSCPNTRSKTKIKEFISCPNCSSKQYCCSDCQQLDWEAGHRNNCSKTLTNRSLNISTVETVNDFSFSQSSSASLKKKTPEDYEIVNNIEIENNGSNKSNKVQLRVVREKDNPRTMYAMKIMNKKELKVQNKTEGLRNEIKTRRKLKHPHIIQLHQFFEDKENTYLILDFAERGSLQSYMDKKEKIEETEAFVYFSQTCIGLDYMHKKSVFYPHLQFGNILLDKSKNVKLNDFKPLIDDLNKASESTTSLNYFAPELLQNQQYNWKVDMWSLGILLYRLLHNQFPFQSGDIQADLNKIASRAIEFGNISNESKDLVNSLLSLDPNQRLDLSAVFSHKWMQTYAAKLKINLSEYIYNSQPKTPEKDVLGSLEYRNQSELIPTQAFPSAKFNPFLSPTSGQKVLVSPEPKNFENKIDQSSPNAMKLEKPKSQSPNQKNETSKGNSPVVIAPYNTVNAESLENYQSTSSTANRSMPDSHKASYSTSPDKLHVSNNSDMDSLLKQYKGDNPQEMRLLDKLDNFYTTGQMKTPVSASPLHVSSNPNKLSSSNQPPINQNKFEIEIEEEYNNKLLKEQNDDVKNHSRGRQFSFGEKNKLVEGGKIQQGNIALKSGRREEEQRQLNEPIRSSPNKHQENGYHPQMDDDENPDYETQSQDLMRKYKSQLNNIYRRSSSNAHENNPEEKSYMNMSKSGKHAAENASYVEVDNSRYKYKNKGSRSTDHSPSKETEKERIIENPDLAMNWLNNRQADKDLDLSFMPRSLRYNLKTIDQSYSELRKKTMQLEFMMNGIDDEELEPDRVSRNSWRNNREISNTADDYEQDKEEPGFFTRVIYAMGCFQRENKDKPSGKPSNNMYKRNGR